MYVQLFFHINLSIILIPPTGFSYHYGDEITDRKSTIDLKNEAVKSWEPGKSYDYTITIRSTDLSVAVKIMDWQETNTSVEWN